MTQEIKGEILIVDDNHPQVKLVGRFLEKHNFAVSASYNGEEALAKLTEKPFDLILLDMTFKDDLDGLDIFKQIRELKPEQKVLFVSGYAENERISQGLEMGAVGFIQKPISLKKLTQRISDCLSANPNKE